MKNIISGVYAITNTKNGRQYIGSTNDVSKRWGNHTHLLINNQHHAKGMQEDWNLFGGSVFIFSTIELCEKEILCEREQFHLNNNKPYYNTSPTAGSNLGTKYSPETCAKLSEIQKEIMASPEKRKNISQKNKLWWSQNSTSQTLEHRLNIVKAKHFQSYGHPMPSDMVDAWLERESGNNAKSDTV